MPNTVSVTSNVKLSAEQKDNVQFIASWVQQKGLPQWVATFSVGDAWQETGLINLPRGAGTSAGLWQQTDYYGTAAQRTDRAWALGMFVYGGTGANGIEHIKGLVDQPNWQSYADGNNWDKLAIAIQKPNVNAYYSPVHDIRDSMALAKTIMAGAEYSKPDANAVPAVDCRSTSATAVDTALLTNQKGSGNFTTNTSVTYPGVQSALARAKQLAGDSSLQRSACHASNCYHHCDEVAAWVWGYGNSGYNTALIHWQSMLSGGQGHAGDRNPPVGALLFYGTGSSSGHVAVYLGDNLALSNDVGDKAAGKTGGVYIVPTDSMEGKVWNLRYLGWSSPTFAGARISGAIAA